MSHVPNISQSFASSVRVPTMYAPYGISCRTFFFTFLSIAPPAAANAPVPNQIMRRWSSRGPVNAPFGVVDYFKSPTRFRTCIALSVIILLGAPGVSSPNGVGVCFGCFAYHSAIFPSRSG